MNRQALIERVKIKVDEYTPTDEGVFHPLDAYIDPLMDEAAKDILRQLPLPKIPVEQYPGSEFAQTEGTKNVIQLPESVVRVVSVKLTGWARAVTLFATEGSKEEAMQSNEHTRGTSNRPVVVMSRDKTTSYTTRLDCYGSATAVGKVMVVTEKKPEEMPGELIEPMITLTAAKVCMSVERDKSYQLLMAEYQKYL